MGASCTNIKWVSYLHANVNSLFPTFKSSIAEEDDQHRMDVYRLPELRPDDSKVEAEFEVSQRSYRHLVVHRTVSGTRVS